MNERLAAFLMWLVQNPDKLDAFNEDATARSNILKEADLTDAERVALQEGDSGTILELLQATEEDGLTWIGIPRIRTSDDDPTPRIKFTVGFAVFRIKGPEPLSTASLTRTGSRAAGTRKSGARAARKRGASSRASKTSKTSKTSKAKTSRAPKKRKR
jgi:hypothetical protein